MQRIKTGVPEIDLRLLLNGKSEAITDQNV